MRGPLDGGIGVGLHQRGGPASVVRIAPIGADALNMTRVGFLARGGTKGRLCDGGGNEAEGGQNEEDEVFHDLNGMG